MRYAWLVAVLGALAIGGCSGGGDKKLQDATGLAGLQQPMAIHLAPDGRVVVTEAGTGADDGRVSIVGADGQGRTVVLEGLPSVSGLGEPWGSVSGAAGAAVAPDGVACAAIGVPAPAPSPLGELRCSDGLKVDLLAWEREHNPDKLAVASRPFDVAADGNEGWWVSDALANTVLHVGRDGQVVLAGVFPSFGTFETPTEGMTTGLIVAGTSAVSAASVGPRGGIPERGGVVVALFNGALAVVRPVDPPDPGLGFAKTPKAIAVFATEEALYYLLHTGDAPGLYDTSRKAIWTGSGGTGFVRLPDGSFLVSIGSEGRLVRVPAEGQGQ